MCEFQIMNRWTEMQVFVESVKLGGFSAAGRSLGLSPSAVSKLVSRLEERLSVRLLNRTTRQINLTEAGHSFYQRCIEILHEIDDAETEISELGLSPSGIVKINCSPGFAHHQLLALLPDFQAKYPSVKVDLQLTGKVVDLVAEGVDVAIRLGELNDSSLVASVLGESERFVCASPEYLNTHGVPETPKALLNHNCLLLSTNDSFNRWEFIDSQGDECSIDVSGQFITDNVETLYNYAVQGAGVVRLSGFMVNQAVEEERLIVLLPGYRTNKQWVHAVYPHRRFLPFKVRVFIDFLKSNLKTENW